jgi:hypothetical protein
MEIRERAHYRLRVIPVGQAFQGGPDHLLSIIVERAMLSHADNARSLVLPVAVEPFLQLFAGP